MLKCCAKRLQVQIENPTLLLSCQKCVMYCNTRFHNSITLHSLNIISSLLDQANVCTFNVLNMCVPVNACTYFDNLRISKCSFSFVAQCNYGYVYWHVFWNSTLFTTQIKPCKQKSCDSFKSNSYPFDKSRLENMKMSSVWYLPLICA